MITNANHRQKERKGASKIVFSILDGFKGIGVKLLIIAIFAIAIPVVFLMVVFNLIFQGKATVRMPKKIVKHIIKNEKNKKASKEE